MDDEYLAGLWRADLFHQLQWYSAKAGRHAPKYRAPTWSWASLDNAKICYEHSESTYDRQEGESGSGPWNPKLLHVEVVPSGQNRFGDVKSAKLALLAPVREMPLYADVDAVPSADDLDGEDEAAIVTKSEPADALPKTDGQHLRFDEESARLDPSLKIIGLNSTSCLIVEPVNGVTEPQVFRRVGYWVCPMRGSTTFGPSGGEAGMGGWETKVVVLI
jgi:hypothetical protein